VKAAAEVKVVVGDDTTGTERECPTRDSRTRPAESLRPIIVMAKPGSMVRGLPTQLEVEGVECERKLFRGETANQTSRLIPLALGLSLSPPESIAEALTSLNGASWPSWTVTAAELKMWRAKGFLPRPCEERIAPAKVVQVSV